MQCATHPNVETELACGRCGKPICPRCLVYTPVGVRCRDCAQVRRIPTYNVSLAYLLRGIGAAVAMGAAIGGLWAFLLPQATRAYGFYVLFLALGIGYAIGESVSWATNRKRGPTLQGIAAAGVILAYLVHNLVAGLEIIPRDDIYGYVLTGIAIVIAIGRLR
jgi:hypothetical protein